MRTTQKKSGVRLSSVLYMIHFGFHVVIGLVAIMAGVIVIIKQRILYAGFALIGAAVFALTNAAEGFSELFSRNKQQE